MIADLLTHIYWRQPLWLLLVLLPLVLWLWKQYLQQVGLRHYADRALHPWIKVRTIRKHQSGLIAISMTTWLLIGIAASGPRLLSVVPNNLQPEQGALMMVVDLSRSMHAADVHPDRIQLAHRTLARWSSDLPSVKTGLTVFAGKSHIVLPPSHDQQAVKQAIEMIRGLRLPSHGSAVIHALSQSKSLLELHDGTRTILLITDGDFDEQTWKTLDSFTKELTRHNIEVHIVGIGSLSPTTIKENTGQWLAYNNQSVTTRLNEQALIKWAAQPGIHYTRLNPDVHQKLSDIWRPRTMRLDKQHENQVIWQELFPWFLLPAMLLILAQHIRIPLSASAITSSTGLLNLGLTLLIAITLTRPIQADNEQSLMLAYEAWQQNNYAAAASRYAAIDGYDARMGEGASCFRNGNLECAINAFSTAAWQADSDQQRGQAAYNLGNSYFRQGNFPAAITLYLDALTYQPNEEVYVNNLEFTEEVQRQIELRLRQEAASLAKRLGPGWRTRRVEQGRELSPDTSVMLDEPVEDRSKDQRRISIPDELIQQYLQNHQQHASLQQDPGDVYERQYDWSQFNQQEPMAANEMAFWQRLFEMEEGMMVSPDKPVILPGVRPW